MKHLIIIGTRGYGRAVFDMATAMKGYGSKFIIKGFLDEWTTINVNKLNINNKAERGSKISPIISSSVMTIAA